MVDGAFNLLEGDSRISARATAATFGCFTSSCLCLPVSVLPATMSLDAVLTEEWMHRIAATGRLGGGGRRH